MYQTTLAPAAIVGTDLLFGMTLSFVGSGIHVLFGHADQALVFKMLLGTKVPGQTLQVAMSLVFGYLGLHMSWKGLAPLLGHEENFLAVP